MKDEAKRAQVEALAKTFLGGQQSLTHKELIAAVMEKTACGESSAKTRIREMSAWGYAIKGPDERYRLGAPL